MQFAYPFHIFFSTNAFRKGVQYFVQGNICAGNRSMCENVAATVIIGCSYKMCRKNNRYLLHFYNYVFNSLTQSSYFVANNCKLYLTH